MCHHAVGDDNTSGASGLARSRSDGEGVIALIWTVAAGGRGRPSAAAEAVVAVVVAGGREWARIREEERDASESCALQSMCERDEKK